MVHPAVREAASQLRRGNQDRRGRLEKLGGISGLKGRRETFIYFPVLNCQMKFVFVILLLALAATGCTTRSNARLAAQNAYLAGQNQALRQQLDQQQQSNPQAVPTAGVTVVGSVQNPHVPWVTGLTLAQAVATANYVDAKPPSQVILTRQGESANIDVKVLLNGPDVPLENGDVIELRP